jgi:hypothetical protein
VTRQRISNLLQEAAQCIARRAIFTYILHFMSLISTADDLGGSYRRFRCLSKYIHELSPTDDGCWPPLIVPGSSILKLSRSEASSTREPSS